MEPTRRVSDERRPGRPAPPFRHGFAWIKTTLVGVSLAVGVYLITNPYIVINLLTNREVLASNFGNSLAMYDVSRILEGFVRVMELTVEGATLPVLALGVAGLLFALRRRKPVAIVLVVPALTFFLQFVLIGAGKPAEYGRFGIFPNTALAIAAACVIVTSAKRGDRLRFLFGASLSVLLICWAGLFGWSYLCGFVADASDQNSRMKLASNLSELARDSQSGRISQVLGTFTEPGPYCFPPIDFAHADLRLVPLREDGLVGGDSPEAILAPLETTNTPISWGNKEFFDSRLDLPVSRDAIPLGR